MPSFDIVSQVDTHEAGNAVDQANREVSTRFDFKGTGAKFELNDNTIKLSAPEEFQLKQMLDILRNKLARREIDASCLEEKPAEIAGQTAHQDVIIRQGIDAPLAKRIVKMIKETKLKVQSSIQGDKVRITGKKRDDLQSVIALMKEAKIDLPLQYENFRD